MSRIARSRITPVGAALAVAGLATGLAAAAPASAATDSTVPRVVSASIDDGLPRIADSIRDEFAVMPAVGYGNKITITVRATDNVGVDAVAVVVFRNGRVVTDDNGNEAIFGMTRSSGTARDGVWKSWVRHDRTDPQDVYAVRVVAIDKAENFSESKLAGRYVTRYKTRVVNFNAGPEPAKPGGVVTLTGRLEHVTAAKGWRPHQDSVSVQFRAKGSSTWVHKGLIEQTAEDGTFNTGKRFHAKQPGTWRVLYSGSMRDVWSTSGGDFVGTS
jgi:hypothetical protein